MLCFLVLYGCKRQILDPLNPQTNLPQKVQFDKVKGLYENGRYKNQPKRTAGNENERMTAADSARFKDFEPEWDKVEIEPLPNNEKMLIVPVVRFLNVDYNQEIGFIRRLCIRVDANDDFLEANIVELVGNLTFVKGNYNTIFANYKNTNISGFSGVVTVSSLDYSSQVVKGYKDDLFVGITQMPTQEIDPATGRVSTCVAFSTVWISTHYCHNAGLPNHGTATNCNSNGGYWASSYSFFTCDSGESSGGTGSGDGGETTYSGGTDPNNVPPPPLPCKGSNCPPKDTGVSWELEEDIDISLPISPEDSLKLVEFNKIMRIGNKVAGAKERTKQALRFAKTLHKLKQKSPLVQKICDRIELKLVRFGLNLLIFIISITT